MDPCKLDFFCRSVLNATGSLKMKLLRILVLRMGNSAECTAVFQNWCLSVECTAVFQSLISGFHFFNPATKGNSITNKGTYVLQEKQNTWAKEHTQLPSGWRHCRDSSLSQIQHFTSHASRSSAPWQIPGHCLQWEEMSTPKKNTQIGYAAWFPVNCLHPEAESVTGCIGG